MARPEPPPGPSFAPLQALRLLRDPVAFFEGLQRSYGDAFTVPIPLFGRIAYFSDPEVVKELFRADPAVFHAGEANADALGPVVGANSVITLDDDAHLRERKLLLPPFHGDRIQRYVERFEEIAARAVARWPVGEPFALRPRMQELSLEVILRTVYGVDDDGRVREYHRRVAHMMRVSNIPVWVPALRFDAGRWSPWGRFLRARAGFDELVHEEIERGLAEPGALAERDDVLSMLLQARREDGRGLTREELRDELTTVIVAGHETTATALTWFFERVLRHPEVEERLRTGDDAYLDATVHEVFRTRPPFFDVVRRLAADAELGGFRIPRGMMVGLPIVLVHQRPDVYPEPRAFRPERFLDASPGGFTWIPFGGGIHRCIGASFALLEMRTIARAILARTRFRVADPAPERARTNNVMMVPEHGARVVLEERADPASSVTGASRTITAA